MLHSDTVAVKKMNKNDDNKVLQVLISYHTNCVGLRVGVVDEAAVTLLEEYSGFGSFCCRPERFFKSLSLRYLRGGIEEPTFVATAFAAVFVKSTPIRHTADFRSVRQTNSAIHLIPYHLQELGCSARTVRGFAHNSVCSARTVRGPARKFRSSACTVGPEFGALAQFECLSINGIPCK
ncbi:hypothetical protein Y032_0195g1485 [Ancylostoma ceylanicum]|uniref:Uncharacterized protein n=1 Tax=Ancylostoma ceylanicum TaxID=53326 RepID=A0A016SPK8_9BILA|nr:hypothetical protein Y032_0195g1485 [Ancylostoma ceylanicum]